MAVAAIVVIALFAGLVVSGALPLLRSPPAAPPTTYSVAEHAAASALQGFQGINWTPVLATSLASPIAVAGPSFASTASSYCQVAPSASSGSGPLTIPPTTSVGSGASSFWEFLFSDRGGFAAVVAVVNGSAIVSAVISGTCMQFLSLVGSIPNAVIDSTTVVNVAARSGGAAFLAAHPNASASLSLVGPAGFFGATAPATWTLSYADCPPTPSTVHNVTAPGTGFNVTVNAVTGDLVGVGNQTPSCPSLGGSGFSFPPTIIGPPAPPPPPPPAPPSPTIAGNLVLGTPGEAAVGPNTWYNFSVQSASGPLVFGDLGFQVMTGSGGVVAISSTWTMTVLGITGSVIAGYDLSGLSWLFGASFTVSSQDELSLMTVGSGGSLSGDDLVVFGTGAYTGTLSVAIP